MKKSILILPIAATIIITSCKKDPIVDPTSDSTLTNAKIFSSISTNVAVATYYDLSNQSELLYSAVQQLIANPTQAKLIACQDLWKSARAAWEQSEGFLFGPVSTDNIDPRIDTWPVDFNGLLAEINGTTDFSIEANIDALDDALKGFHPIEYLIFGENGAKTYDQFTAREFEFLDGLAKNLQTLTAHLANQWNIASPTSYFAKFNTPTSLNPFYQTNRAVYEELVNALIGICDEVASGKIGEPFHNQDPSLEESPYSQNSMTDFRNNIKSVQNIYLGKYITDGTGIEDLVRKHNLSLDNTIKSKINAASSTLNNITVPFGTAITTQQVQVQNAIDAIEDLKNTLETQLLPFIQQYVTN